MAQIDHFAVAARELSSYAAILEPRFELAPHVKLLVEHLEAVERGGIDRLMVFMPPRHGKSMLSSTLFPAWFLGKHPDREIICASYGQELANDFGRRVRSYIKDPLHSSIFPQSIVSEDSAAVHRLEFARGGHYFAVGAGGPITGRGANLLLLDDVLKDREQAYSAVARQSLKSWFQHTAYTRLAPGGAIVNIATRWHQDDLSGWLLKEFANEGWVVLSLPAIAELDDPLGRPEGAALWWARFPADTLERIKDAIGSSAWAALYQQRPIAAEGSVFRRESFRSYSTPPECSRVIFSLDTAFKTGQASDYSVITVWGENKNSYSLLEVLRERLDFPALVSSTIALNAFHRPHCILIEDAASGQSLIQSLKADTKLPILAVKPLGDKLARANAVAPTVESGLVALPDSAPWLADFVEEVCSFPAAPHDDCVDSMTQALSWFRANQYQKIEFTPAPIPGDHYLPYYTPRGGRPSVDMGAATMDEVNRQRQAQADWDDDQAEVQTLLRRRSGGSRYGNKRGYW